MIYGSLLGKGEYHTNNEIKRVNNTDIRMLKIAWEISDNWHWNWMPLGNDILLRIPVNYKRIIIDDTFY